jgi:hypothetical protein
MPTKGCAVATTNECSVDSWSVATAEISNYQILSIG